MIFGIIKNYRKNNRKLFLRYVANFHTFQDGILDSKSKKYSSGILDNFNNFVSKIKDVFEKNKKNT